jgi:hypothetical protein
MKMRCRYLVFPLLLLVVAAKSSTPVDILSADSTTIVFARGKVPEGVAWSQAMQLTERGLETKPLDSPNASWDFWMQSQIIPVGLSWRPPTSINLKLSANGYSMQRGYLRTYFRYSSDKVHWSSWYELAVSDKDTNGSAAVYQGDISLPRVAGERYSELMRQWWKTDPDWSSDEHEFCVWLAKNHPEYFSTEQPFIGYIQIRFEGSGSYVRVENVKIDQFWGVGGLHSFPKRKTRETTEGKWFFDLSKYQVVD